MKKAFNQDIDESWIDWANEMMEAGYESDNLYILAGEIRPYNQFELQTLTNKIFADLGLFFNDKNKAMRDFIYFLAINNSGTYLKSLRELKNICVARDMDQNYMNFYLLYFAKEDLEIDGNQFYWNGANRNNIDSIIENEFQKFIDKVDKNK